MQQKATTPWVASMDLTSCWETRIGRLALRATISRGGGSGCIQAMEGKGHEGAHFWRHFIHTHRSNRK